MKKNSVTIKFSGGDEFKIIIDANRPEVALKWAKRSEEYQAFEAEHIDETIIGIEIKPVFWAPTDSPMSMTNSPSRRKWYYVDYEAAGIRFEFKKGHLNDMQRVWRLPSNEEVDPREVEATVKEIVDWVTVNFPEMVNEPPKRRHYLSNEGVISDKKPNARGAVPCYYTLKVEVAEFIKAKAHEMGITQGKLIELICKDTMDFSTEN